MFDRFCQAMRGFAPFEARPHIAVALSGGADSLGLCLLAHDWVVRQGGRLTALTVDHGLRDGSDKEALKVADWMASRGIDHVILTWDGQKPETGLQQAARKARYRILENWCEENRVLHLLLAHHKEDQAETVLMRLQKKSGPVGLAGMSAITDRPFGRLLRPLLACSTDDLRRFLHQQGQDWIEDPSNRNTRFARARIRQSWDVLTGQGITPENLAQTASEMADIRIALEDSVARCLARAVTVCREGFASLKSELLTTYPDEISSRVLAATIRMVGCTDYSPNRDRVLKTLRALQKGQTRSLGGCQVVMHQGQLLVVRENPRNDLSCLVRANETVVWDRRFELLIHGQKGASACLAPLGEAGWAEIIRKQPDLRQKRLHLSVIRTLPALFDEEGVFQVPHLDYNSPDCPANRIGIEKVRFIPHNALTNAGFGLAVGR